MNSKSQAFGLLLFAIPSLLFLAGCGKVQADPAQGAPPDAKVVPIADAALFSVDHPEQFPLAAATQHPTTSELVVTGTVTPDVSRNVPVVSLASGRVMSIHARLGDTVQKGQLLLTVRSDDVSGGYSNYRMAVADEMLARTQYERSKDLYAHGAIALHDLQVAQDTEDKAKIAVETLAEHLRLIGNDPDKPASMVDIFAPVSGVITDQQVTTAAAIQAFNTPSPFTISDLSSVWVVCDVYENDMANVRLGDTADITLNAYPDRRLAGRVTNISKLLDPNTRAAKVRIERNLHLEHGAGDPLLVPARRPARGPSGGTRHRAADGRCIAKNEGQPRLPSDRRQAVGLSLSGAVRAEADNGDVRPAATRRRGGGRPGVLDDGQDRQPERARTDLPGRMAEDIGNPNGRFLRHVQHQADLEIH